MTRRRNSVIGLGLLVLYIFDFTLASAVPYSCAYRCGHDYDRSMPCQCNDLCVRYSSCCDDYVKLCNPAARVCESVEEVSRNLWEHDFNRIPDSNFRLNYQGQVQGGTHEDAAPERLFSYMDLDDALLFGHTYAAYLSLLDNYNPEKDVAETTTPEEENEVKLFLDTIFYTPVMQTLFRHFLCLGVVNDPGEFREMLHKLWFEGYSRSSKSHVIDTSGFEHVMVGEYRSSSSVNGFHYWLSFYEKEKAGHIKYHGYVRRQEPHLIAPSFSWLGHLENPGSFIVGTSPEFDLAIYTLCFVVRGSSPCVTNMGGHDVIVHTYNKGGHIATAYMDVE